MLWRGAQHSFHKIHDAQCDSQLTSFVSHARCSCSRLGDCVRNGVKSSARRVFRVDQRWHIRSSKRRKAPFLGTKLPSKMPSPGQFSAVGLLVGPTCAFSNHMQAFALAWNQIASRESKKVAGVGEFRGFRVLLQSSVMSSASYSVVEPWRAKCPM